MSLTYEMIAGMGALPEHRLRKILRHIVIPQDAPTGCWIWRGSFAYGGQPVFQLGNKKMYPITAIAKRLGLVHPEAQRVMPRCGNVRCANPWHRGGAGTQPLPSPHQSAPGTRVVHRMAAPLPDLPPMSVLDSEAREARVKAYGYAPYFDASGRPIRVDAEGEVYIWNFNSDTWRWVRGGTDPLWPRINIGGTHQVRKDYIVACAWWGYMNPGTHVRHLDDNRANSNPLNLEWPRGLSGMPWPEWLINEAQLFWDRRVIPRKYRKEKINE